MSTQKDPNQKVPLAKSVKKVTPSNFVTRSMKIYGEEVVKGRAIPDFRDGLKPVQRRIIYWMKERNASNRIMKLARIVGGVMGELHPHGDAAITSAAVNLAQTKTHFPYVHGEGNWGGLVDKAGAMRYIECKAHDNAKYLLEYSAITEKMTNYDGQWMEPVYLPATIPSLLITGASGIAVGAKTNIPAHKPKLVIKATTAFMEGERSVQKLVKILKGPTYRYGGWVTSERKELRQMYKVGNGAIYFCGDFESDAKKDSIFSLTGFPQNINVEKAIDKLADQSWVSKVVNESGINKETNYLVYLKRNASLRECEPALTKQIKSFISYDWNVTLSNADQELTEFKHVDLLTYLEMWCDYRKELELKWLNFQIEKRDKDIWKLETVMKAYKNLDKVVKCLRMDNAKQNLMKRIKFTEEQADYVLSLRLSTLTKTNTDEVNKAIVKLTKELKKIRRNIKGIDNYLVELLQGCEGMF